MTNLNFVYFLITYYRIVAKRHASLTSFWLAEKSDLGEGNLADQIIFGINLMTWDVISWRRLRKPAVRKWWRRVGADEQHHESSVSYIYDEGLPFRKDGSSQFNGFDSVIYFLKINWQ